MGSAQATVSDNLGSPASGPLRGERDEHIRRAAHALRDGDRGALSYLYVGSVDRLASDLSRTLGAEDAEHFARRIYADVWAEADRFDADACSFYSWLRELASRRLAAERGPAGLTA